jgi:hypothetical protein
LFIATLKSANTTKAEQWNCSIRLHDGQYSSEWENSTTLLILNSPPVVTLSNPADDAVSGDRTPEFTWTAEDDDDDGLTYEINMTPYYQDGNSAGAEDVRNEAGLSELTYTPSTDLQYLHDNGFHYRWSVRADDGEVNGSWTSEWLINVSATVDTLFVTDYDEVNFGTINPLVSNDTTDNSPNPFILENVGTVMSNISVNSTDLWSTVDVNSDYYKFKIDNNTIGDENGSFNWGLSNTSWAQFPLTGNVISIVELNYSDATDTAEIDIYIDTPQNEPPSTRGALVVFTSSLGE